MPYTPAAPTGPIQFDWYRHGYQAAMADIAAALERGGEDAVRQWVADNTLAQAAATDEAMGIRPYKKATR